MDRKLGIALGWKFSLRLAVIVVTLLTLLSACAQAAAPTPTPAPKSAAPVEKPAATAAPASEKPAAQKPAGEQKPAALTKIKVANTSISVTQMIPYFAKEKGIFQKYGLDVEYSLVQSTPPAVAAMLAGEIQMLIGAQEAVVTSVFAGSDLEFVLSGPTTILRYLIVAPSITKGEDLRGQKVGVTKFGTSTEFAAKYALRDMGLEPGRDVALLQVGTMPDMLAALQAGGLQGATLSPPTSSQAKGLGYKVLYDFAAKKFPYLGAGVIARKSWVKDHEDVVRNFAKAYIEATAMAKKDKATTVEVIKNFTKVTDPQQLADAYDEWLLTMPEKPYPTAAAIKTSLNEMPDEPKAKTADPNQFFDTRFVEELDKSGFIDSVNKN